MVLKPVHRYHSVLASWEFWHYETFGSQLLWHTWNLCILWHQYFTDQEVTSYTKHNTDPLLILHFLEFLQDSQGRRIETKGAFERVALPSGVWDKGGTLLQTWTREWTFWKQENDVQLKDQLRNKGTDDNRERRKCHVFRNKHNHLVYYALLLYILSVVAAWVLLCNLFWT